MRIWKPFSLPVLVLNEVAMNTARPRYICSNRPHLALVLRGDADIQADHAISAATGRI